MCIWYDYIIAQDNLNCHSCVASLEFLPLTQDFGANSIHVYETMKRMVPPHISTNVKPILMPKAMRPGCKIIPKVTLEPPRHATNSRLLKWSMTSGGSSPGSSLSGISPQSSGKYRIENVKVVVSCFNMNRMNIHTLSTLYYIVKGNGYTRVSKMNNNVMCNGWQQMLELTKKKCF